MRESAIKLAQRERWDRRPAGDGTQLVQVMVPGDKLVQLSFPTVRYTGSGS